VSKTLVPALRLGWLAVPSRLVEAIAEEKLLADRTTAQIDQHAFAHFLDSGELDRHLRRMRVRYRARRDALVVALAEELPEARVEGIAAGLHATVRLPEDYDEQAIVEEAARRRVAIEVMGDYRSERPGPPTLLLGYGQIADPSIRPGIRALAEAVRATRA
jgi:GntR family transcriptional regulator/MocR family aminotransferase